jgi:hypothetical protein
MTNSKYQIPNKFQNPISNDPNAFVWNFDLYGLGFVGYWVLAIWCLSQ